MVREVVFFSFFSFRCLLPHHFERSAWFLDTTDLPAGPKERGRGGPGPHPHPHRVHPARGFVIATDLFISAAGQARVGDSAPPALPLCAGAGFCAGAGLGGSLLPTARRPGTAGNRSCPWVQRDREERSLADAPGGRQKHICVFDLILKQIRESVGNGVGPIPSNIIIVVFMVFHF